MSDEERDPKVIAVLVLLLLLLIYLHEYYKVILQVIFTVYLILLGIQYLGKSTPKILQSNLIYRFYVH